MKVFISWSGERSKMVASALHEWLPLMFETIEPWMSSTDINKGARWADQLSRQLEQSNAGVVCITPENIESPWLLFESGSLAKTVSASLVCTLVVGMDKTKIKGPLSQFQHTEPNEADMLQFVKTLNRAKEPPSRSELAIGRLFENLWPLLQKTIEELPRQRSVRSTAEALHYYSQKALLLTLEATPKSADLFFNDQLLGSSPQTIRVNPDAATNTISAAAANHFDWHSVILQKDLEKGAISIALENKTGGAFDKHVTRWLRDRRRYPDNPVLTRAIVTYLCAIEEKDEAVAEAEIAIKLAPEWFMSYNAMGYALLAKHEIDRAIRYFNITVAMQPSHFLGYYNLASAYALQKNFPQCIKNLESILNNRDVLSTLRDAKHDPAREENRSTPTRGNSVDSGP